ncbi:hypothetical protein ACJJTC_005985 [Scirpophaga incertulas]
MATAHARAAAAARAQSARSRSAVTPPPLRSQRAHSSRVSAAEARRRESKPGKNSTHAIVSFLIVYPHTLPPLPGEVTTSLSLRSSNVGRPSQPFAQYRDRSANAQVEARGSWLCPDFR